MQNKAALAICFDTGKLLEIAETAGAPGAPAVSVSSTAYLDKAVEETGFPLVIKPSDSTIPLRMGRPYAITRFRLVTRTCLMEQGWALTL